MLPATISIRLTVLQGAFFWYEESAVAGAFLSVRGLGRHSLTPYASHVIRLRRLVDVETGDLADSSGDHHQENVLALFRFG